MSNYSKTPRNTVKRVPKRGHYDKATVHSLLDDSFVCHVGFSVEGQPYVLPTLYGRKGDTIYLHGAVTSRLMTHLEKEVPVCVTVTHVDGLVLARSVFHHSANYRSAVLFGKARSVAPENKMEAFEQITNHIIKGRWEEARLPNAKELKATAVLAFEIEEASAKIREGGPVDDKEDYELPIWAGVVPIREVIGEAIADERLAKGIVIPDSVQKYVRS